MIFHKNTLVGTQNGAKFIFDVTIDDYLIGDNYSSNKITSIKKFYDTLDVYRIKGLCTPTLYCLPGTQLLTREKIYKYDRLKKHSSRTFADKKFVLVDNIESNHHFLAIPINKNNGVLTI